MKSQRLSSSWPTRNSRKKSNKGPKIFFSKTQDLIHSHARLETQNVELIASHKKLEELYSTKKATFEKLEDLYKNHLTPLKITLDHLESKVADESRADVQKAGSEVMNVISMLEPITSLYHQEQAMQSQKILLVESQKKQQILAKMALGGTGAELEIANSAEEAADLLKSHSFDIIFVDENLFEFCSEIPKLCPTAEVVLMTGNAAPQYIQKLKSLPYMPNIISRNSDDRTFTMKNIVTSVSKLTSKDVFGVDKYLSWGVEVHEELVASSADRPDLIAKTVTLSERHQAQMRYATDGMMMGVSVQDPNGSLRGEIILNYLESCYSGQAGEMQNNKGGAGRGLHQIIENSDLVVFNVRPGVSTEVIALFNVEQKEAVTKEPSFHLFIL